MARKTPQGPEDHKRTIHNRIGLIALFSAIGLVLLFFNFYFPEFISQEKIDSNLNIFFLLNLNVILLLLITLLVLRNLVKIIYERRKKALGFRLKFKLTIAFFLVSSLPMVVFFFIAKGLLKNSVDYWFQNQFTNALHHTKLAAELFEQRERESLFHAAQQSAEDLSRTRLGESLRAKKMQAMLKRYDLSGLMLYDSDLRAKEIYFQSPTDAALWQPMEPDKANLSSVSSGQEFKTRLDAGEIRRVVFPLYMNDELYYLEANRNITGESFKRLQDLRQSLNDQGNLLLLQDPIDANFTFYMLVFTVLIIFAGSWFGFYLARSIVEPLEVLVEGTERISKGDLDFEIPLEGDDEVGMLLEAFNGMTKDLQKNRRQLAASQEELIETYKTLEERNIFVELVLQNIQSGIFFIDNSGYVKGINPYMIELSKIQTKKIIGRHYKSILSKEEIQFFEKLNRELTRTEGNSIRDETHISVNKRSLHIAMELYQLKTQKDEPLGRLLVVHDLSELDRSTRAQAWREVARRVAHEIKNPLTPIQLSAQRIRRKYVDETEETQLLDKATATIIQEVNNLKNMVNEFSKFAKIPEINTSPGDLNEILQDVSSFFAAGLPSSIQLNLDLDENLPKLLLDAEPMRRVFTNLIDNSIAAMKKGGEILISSSYQKDYKLARVEVIDQGHGIPREMMSRIFDPYVTTKKEGTGLGLAIVQQIVTDHGGFIRLENIEKGTKFIIEIPANYRAT